MIDIGKDIRSVSDFKRNTSEARFFEVVEGWTEEERQDAMSHIEEGFLQAERGELVEGLRLGGRFRR